MISVAKIKDGPFIRSGHDFDLVYTDGGLSMSVMVTTMYISMNLALIIVLESGAYLTFPEHMIEWTRTDSGNYPEAMDA